MVRTNLARAFNRQERYYNLRRRAWKPAIGDIVWKRDHPLSNKGKAFNSKLAPKYIGPLEVRKFHSPVVVDLRDKRGKWHRHIHVQDLKPGHWHEQTRRADNAETDHGEAANVEAADAEADDATADTEVDAGVSSLDTQRLDTAR